VITLLLMTACDEPVQFVTLSGTVFDDRYETADPVPGAEVHTVGLDGGEVDRVTADENGWFEATIPAGTAFFVGVDAEGFVPTGFSGQSALSDYQVSDGLVWLRSEEDKAELEGQFAGCPGNDEDGGIVEGWVGVALPVTDTTYRVDLVTTAWVTAYAADGTAYETCYLADDNTDPVYDPDAELTGITGRFTILGSPTGLMTLEAGYWISQEDDYYMEPVYYVIYVPPGGIAPFYPLYVPATL